jgi:hypothetical protein
MKLVEMVNYQKINQCGYQAKIQPICEVIKLNFDIK